ncbi:MAG: acylphosphatase [Zavarzinella sp.]|nr:acylphosphatase [Zavarzinella sp.]
MIAKLVHYSGNVQGVGFRATASMIARRHPVTGWVRNLPDGRVQLLVEGRDEDVAAFLHEIRDRWQGDVDDEQIDDQEPTGRFGRFGIAP